MLVHLSGLLGEPLLAHLRQRLVPEAFVDGATTAHGLARQVKRNLQLTAEQPLGGELSPLVTEALGRSNDLREAAWPVRLTPPMFNLHREGMHYGLHADSALMNGIVGVVRADLSMTIFLSDPASYDGGELAFDDPVLGRHALKLAAGDAIVYPTMALHEVRPVTRGTRLACIVWMQSALPDPRQRLLMHQLSQVFRLVAAGQQTQALTELNQAQQNLLRLWTQT